LEWNNKQRGIEWRIIPQPLSHDDLRKVMRRVQMAKISAIPVPTADKDYVGPIFAQFRLAGYMGNSETGILLSPQLANADEVDHAVRTLIAEAEKAGKEAKGILKKAKA
jgi:hypothetical protein